jgi:hypothetical protein
MKFYPLLFLIFLFAACSGAPDQETVQQVRENQPQKAQPLKEASTKYPKILEDLGLEMPAKTAVIEAGKLSGPEITADALSVKLLTSLSVKEAYQYYKELLPQMEEFTLEFDRLSENEETPLRNSFRISANRNDGGPLIVLGNTAYGTPEKTQISIHYVTPLDN